MEQSLLSADKWASRSHGGSLRYGVGPECTALRADRRRWREAGFTLIELMIVVAIVAILAAIAYPSYSAYVIKTHRAAATGCLSEYANYMERYYTTNLRYDLVPSTLVANALPVLDCADGARYVYTFASPVEAGKYKIQATPVIADPKCGVLSLDQTGKRDSASGTVAQCW